VAPRSGAGWGLRTGRWKVRSAWHTKLRNWRRCGEFCTHVLLPLGRRMPSSACSRPFFTSVATSRSIACLSSDPVRSKPNTRAVSTTNSSR